METTLNNTVNERFVLVQNVNKSKLTLKFLFKVLLIVAVAIVLLLISEASQYVALFLGLSGLIYGLYVAFKQAMELVPEIDLELSDILDDLEADWG